MHDGYDDTVDDQGYVNADGDDVIGGGGYSDDGDGVLASDGDDVNDDSDNDDDDDTHAFWSGGVVVMIIIMTVTMTMRTIMTMALFAHVPYTVSSTVPSHCLCHILIRFTLQESWRTHAKDRPWPILTVSAVNCTLHQ